jgi:hypothetical protein
MHVRSSQALQRVEAQAVRDAQRERISQMAWTELSDANQAQDEKTGRLKALRLARQAEQQG